MTTANIVLSARDTTKAAFASLDASLRGAGQRLDALNGTVQGFLGLGAVAVFTAGLRGAVNELDRLGDTAPKIGLTTQSLAELGFAAKLSGTDAATLEGAIGKLSTRMADAAGGGKEAAAVFSALGIKVKDATGSLKSGDVVLGEIADKFSAFTDGPERAALAVEIFGKSGRELIPLLTQGSKGIEALRSEFRALAGDDLSAAAQVAGLFNDSMDRLQTSTGRFSRQILEATLPALTDLVNGLVTTEKSTRDVNVVAEALATVLETVSVVGANVSYVIKQVGSEIGGLAAQAIALATLDLNGFKAIGEAMKSDAKSAREAVDAYSAGVLRARELASTLAGIDKSYQALENRRLGGGSAGPTQTAPIIAKPTTEAQTAYKSISAELEKQAKLLTAQSELGRNLTDSEKFRIDIIEKISSEATKLTASERALLLIQAKKVADLKDEEERRQKNIKLAQQAYAAEVEFEEERARAEVEASKARESTRSYVQDIVVATEEQTRLLELEASLVGATEQQRGFALEKLRIELQLRKDILEVQRRLQFDAVAQQDAIDRLNADAQAKIANAQKRSILDEFNRTTAQISDSLTDALLRGFESGKGFVSNFVDTLKNLFKTLVLTPTIKAIIQPVAGALTGALGIAGPANAATTGGGIGNLLSLGSNLSTAYSALTGSFINSIGSAATAAGNLFGSTAAAEFGLGIQGFQTFAALEGGVTGALGAGASTGSALSSAAAAGPYVLAAVAALNALGVFRSRRIVDGGLQGELGGQVNDFALERRGGTLFSGPDYRVLDRGVSAQNDELQKAYSAIRTTVAGMAEQLGIGNDAIKDFTVRLGNDLIHPDTGGFGIKTQGLSQDEIIAKIEAALLSANDQLAEFALGTDTFTRNGETATQTLGRLSGSLQTLNGSLDLMGFKVLDASLASADAASRFIDSFGGIEGYLQVSSSFYQNYFTEAERTAKLTEQLTAQFAELGFTLPTSRQGLRDLVQQQIALGTEALPTVAALLKLEGAFASITQATAEAAQTMQVQADALGQQRVQDLQLARTAATETAQRVTELRDQQQAVFTEGVAQMQSGLQVAQALLDAATLISQVQINTLNPFDEKLSADKEAAIIFRNTLNAANQYAENFQRIPNASPGLDKLFEKLESAFLRIDNRLSINGETSASGRAIGLLGLAERADVSPALGFKLSEELNASFKDFLAGGANLLRNELEAVSGAAEFAASRVPTVLQELARAQLGRQINQLSGANVAGFTVSSNGALKQIEQSLAEEIGVGVDVLKGPIEGIFQTIEQRAAESRVKLLDAFGVTEADLASVGDDLQAKLTATVVRAAGASFDEAVGSYRYFVGQIGDMADEIRAAAEQTQTAEQKFSGLFQSFTDSLSRPLAAARGALDESIRAQASLRQILDTGNVTLENRISLEGQLTEATQQVISAQRQLQGINQFAEPVIAAGKQLQALIDASAIAAGQQAIKGLGLSIQGASVAAKIVGSVYKDNAQSVYNAYILLNEAFEQNQISVADYQKSITGVSQQFQDGARSLEEFKQQMQAIVDFRKSLDAGPNALLSPEQQYQAALRDFRQADKENFVAAGQALLDASQAFNAGTAAYFADLEAVKRRADLLTGGGGLLGGLPGFADGGYYPGGLAVVGEQGREIINFRNPGQVYTAPQTRELLAGGGNSDKLAAEVKELRATVVNMGRMMQAAFGQQIQLIEEGNADRRAVVKVTKQVAEGMAS